MVLKVYASIWALGLLLVGITYITGNFNLFTAVVFGFLSFATIFWGALFLIPCIYAPEPKHKH